MKKYNNFTTINTSEDGIRLVLLGVVVLGFLVFTPLGNKLFK